MNGTFEREVELALVLSPDSWVERLHRHCADHGGARVRCVVVEPSVALTESFDVLVVSERWPSLSRPFVDALHAQGRRVLAVLDERGHPEAGFAARVGADATAAADTPSRGLVEAAVRLAPSSPDGVGPGPVRAPSVLPAPGGANPVLAVGGPSGAGSTEVALGVAVSAARHGAGAVLVDVDVMTPAVAVRLGLPLEPNLCTAVDAVAFGLGAVPGALFDLGVEWPAVLVGAPSHAAAAGLSTFDVVEVLNVVSGRFSPVVCDLSNGGVSGNLVAPLASAVVARAGTVLAVGTATPVGVVRLLEWIDAVGGNADAGPIEVVLNRAPNDRGRRAQLTAEIRRHGPIAGVRFVPADPRVDDAAWAAGAADRGAFARAVGELWTYLAPGLAVGAGSAA